MKSIANTASHKRKPATSRSCCARALRIAITVTILQGLLVCQTNGALTAANTMPGQVGYQVATPRLVSYSGNTNTLTGKAKSGTNGMTFSLYEQASGGTPVWTETQNVAVDTQ